MKKMFWFLAPALLIYFSFSVKQRKMPERKRTFETWASWYGPGYEGKLMANGQRFYRHKKTVAHKTLPFGTIIKITNLRNGRYITVPVTDRGPYIAGRGLDLSEAAAQEIQMIRDGVVPVQVEILNLNDDNLNDEMIMTNRNTPWQVLLRQIKWELSQITSLFK